MGPNPNPSPACTRQAPPFMQMQVPDYAMRAAMQNNPKCTLQPTTAAANCAGWRILACTSRPGFAGICCLGSAGGRVCRKDLIFVWTDLTRMKDVLFVWVCCCMSRRQFSSSSRRSRSRSNCKPIRRDGNMTTPPHSFIWRGETM